MLCGCNKPEGFPQYAGDKVKHKKVKWINDYRLDHISKLREHCSILCVPCGRAKTNRRVQIANSLSPGAAVAANSTATTVAMPARTTAQQTPTQNGSASSKTINAGINAATTTHTLMSPPANVSQQTAATSTSSSALLPPPVVA